MNSTLAKPALPPALAAIRRFSYSTPGQPISDEQVEENEDAETAYFQDLCKYAQEQLPPTTLTVFFTPRELKSLTKAAKEMGVGLGVFLSVLASGHGNDWCLDTCNSDCVFDEFERDAIARKQH